MSLSEHKNFFIAALPRSRTAWLANLFCNQDSFCYHESLFRFGFGTLPDLDTKFVGSAETNIDLIPEGYRTLIVHRDHDECYDSLLSSFEPPENVNFEEYKQALYGMLLDNSETLDSMEGLHVDFNDIDDKIEEIWSYLLPDTYIDTNRIDEMTRVNIQVFETDLRRFL